MLNRLRTGVLCCLLIGLGAQSSCATALQLLPKAIAYAQDAGFILQQVERFLDAYYAGHPNPELRERTDQAVARARSALSFAVHTTGGADHLSREELDAAFKDFRDAWSALLMVTGPLGVHSGGQRLAAAPGGGLMVPEPLAVQR